MGELAIDPWLLIYPFLRFLSLLND